MKRTLIAFLAMCAGCGNAVTGGSGGGGSGGGETTFPPLAVCEPFRTTAESSVFTDPLQLADGVVAGGMLPFAEDTECGSVVVGLTEPIPASLDVLIWSSDPGDPDAAPPSVGEVVEVAEGQEWPTHVDGQREYHFTIPHMFPAGMTPMIGVRLQEDLRLSMKSPACEPEGRLFSPSTATWESFREMVPPRDEAPVLGLAGCVPKK